jgi:hypothetical protein
MRHRNLLPLHTAQVSEAVSTLKSRLLTNKGLFVLKKKSVKDLLIRHSRNSINSLLQHQQKKVV